MIPYRFGVYIFDIFAMKKLNFTSFSLLVLAGISLVSSPVLAKSAKKPQGSPAVVEVTTVQAGASTEQLNAVGNLIAIPGVVVKPEIAGRVTNLYFTSGSKVKAGTPLIEIYPNIIKAQLTQAQAELKLAQLNFNRLEKLHKNHTISAADYDKAKATLEELKGKVEQKQANLEQTVVRAPFDGSLGVSLVSAGQYINVGQDMVSLQALDPIYVDFVVPEAEVSKVAAGQRITIHSSVYPKEIFEGTVRAIDPLINKNTRGLLVRASVPNKDEKLLPGGFAEVTLFVGAPKQAIKVPQTAVGHSQSENFVYTVVDGKAVKRVVTTGKIDAQDVVIEDGLNVGDVVVIKGQMQIKKEGDPVTIVTSPKP